MATGPLVRHSSASPGETRAIGEAIGAALGPGSLVLLSGPLGAGKTVLVQGIALGLGVEEPVISPTYTIVAEYPGRIPLAHVDLYRVDGATQLEQLGLDDLLGSGGVTVVEWGEKLEGTLGTPAAVRISLSIVDGGIREILVEEPTP